MPKNFLSSSWFSGGGWEGIVSILPESGRNLWSEVMYPRNFISGLRKWHLMAFMAKPGKLNLWSTESSIGKWSSNPELWGTKSSTYVITFYSFPNTFCKALIKDVVLFLYPYITLVNGSTCFSKSKAIHFVENLASGTRRKTELRSKFVIYLEPRKRCNSSLICATLILSGVTCLFTPLQSTHILSGLCSQSTMLRRFTYSK